MNENNVIPFVAPWNICPKCNGFIDGWPTLSRKDNKIYLCTKCIQREALEERVQYE